MTGYRCNSIEHISDNSNKYIYTESRAVKTQNMHTESSAVKSSAVKWSAESVTLPHNFVNALPLT